MAVLLGLVALGAVACSEQLPTGVDDDLLPDRPVTLEVRLPWGDFASNLEVFGEVLDAAWSPSGVSLAVLAIIHGKDTGLAEARDSTIGCWQKCAV